MSFVNPLPQQLLQPLITAYSALSLVVALAQLVITFGFAVLVPAVQVLPARLHVGQLTVHKVHRVDAFQVQVLDCAVLSSEQAILDITHGNVGVGNLLHVVHDHDGPLEALLPLLDTQSLEMAGRLERLDVFSGIVLAAVSQDGGKVLSMAQSQLHHHEIVVVDESPHIVHEIVESLEGAVLFVVE